MKLYGSDICHQCVEAKKYLEEKKIPYVLVDITANTTNLKEFLKIRDNNDLYHEVKEMGKIGIPTFVMSDGRISLDLNDFTLDEIKQDFKNESSTEVGLCGFDGC